MCETVSQLDSVKGKHSRKLTGSCCDRRSWAPDCEDDLCLSIVVAGTIFLWVYVILASTDLCVYFRCLWRLGKKEDLSSTSISL